MRQLIGVIALLMSNEALLIVISRRRRPWRIQLGALPVIDDDRGVEATHAGNLQGASVALIQRCLLIEACDNTHTQRPNGMSSSQSQPGPHQT